MKTVLAALLKTIRLNFFFFCLQNIHFSMTISPPKIRIFPFFLSVMSTDKPVNRSKHAYAVTQLNVLAFRGFFLSWYSQTKKKEGVWENRATQYKKYVAEKCTRARARARAPLKPNHTNGILESQGGKTSIKSWIALKDTTFQNNILNYSE